MRREEGGGRREGDSEEGGGRREGDSEEGGREKGGRECSESHQENLCCFVFGV